MFKRKCPDCAEKIDKKFSYCPWCGASIKKTREEKDFGLLGRDDSVESQMQPQHQMQGAGLPFGLDKMMGPLMKQLEKELANMEKQQGNMPKNIKISFGNPNMMGNNMQPQEVSPQKKALPRVIISEEEKERRKNLPRQEAESKVKRLSDKIIYEIETPGIRHKSDIAINKLEEGFEIKVYTKEACYTKKIPVEIDITSYKIEEGKVVIEMRNE